MSDIVRVQISATANIREVGYRLNPMALPAERTGTLEVMFAGGGVYRYFEVPQSVIMQLYNREDGEPYGKKFNRLIKQGGYRYEKR